MLCPALPSMSVVLGCAISAPLLLLALSIRLFRDSGLVHSNLSPSIVCGVQEPFQEPLLFPVYVRFLLDGQAGTACVGPVGMATLLFVGFFSSMKAPVGRFQVFVPLATLPVALLVAIVGLAHEFPCVGLAHCFQLFSDALLAAACSTSVGIISFFTILCALAAWPSALVSLKMIGYVSSAAAGIAASLVLFRVFVCDSAAAARLSAFISVEGWKAAVASWQPTFSLRLSTIS